LLAIRRRGVGGFDEDEAVPLDDPAFALAAADLDGDGAAELLAASHRTLTIVGGASEATSALEVGRGPVDLDLAALDGDGDLDVVIVDLEDGALTSLLGDGAGGLTLAATLPIGPATDEVDLADLDGDGRVDAIVRARIFDAAWIAAGDGAGGFDLPVEVALEDALETRGLAAIGPNTSGLVTLLAPSTEGLLALLDEHRTLRLVACDGAGTLEPIATPSVELARIAAGDLDGDGDGDLLGVSLDDRLQPLLREGDALDVRPSIDVSALLPWTEMQGRPGLALDDLDGDGQAEALLFSYTHLAALADLGSPAPSVSIDHALDEGYVHPEARPLFGDFDGDGARDLAFLDDTQLTLVRGVDGGFAGVALTVEAALSAALDVADLDGDGRTAVLSAATDEVRIFEAADVRLPKVSARLDLPYPSPSPSGRVQPGVFGDFNGDGRVDALFNLGDTLTIAWGDDGRFRERVSIPWPRGAAPSGPALAAADLDGDGRDEALLSKRARRRSRAPPTSTATGSPSRSWSTTRATTCRSSRSSASSPRAGSRRSSRPPPRIPSSARGSRAWRPATSTVTASTSSSSSTAAANSRSSGT
ncbi:MAG: VCBS repeat-containing protein, partial [Myxococcales bacterium]|nr:VCBS repeat-containing protein [Myxococcales bacterium]